MASCQRRNTHQRQMVLDQLRASYSHPTAGELYQAVREFMPRISLGTVYRNLDVLQETGQAIRLAGIVGSEARYDGHCAPHLHFQCHQCGRIHDIESAWPTLEEMIGQTIEGHAISGYQAMLTGTCRDCAEHDLS